MSVLPVGAKIGTTPTAPSCMNPPNLFRLSDKVAWYLLNVSAFCRAFCRAWTMKPAPMAKPIAHSIKKIPTLVRVNNPLPIYRCPHSESSLQLDGVSRRLNAPTDFPNKPKPHLSSVPNEFEVTMESLLWVIWFAGDGF